MKQPEDTKTLDLIETQKRGRGRPAVAHPLSPAERAKRYRANKKQRSSNKSDATKNIDYFERRRIQDAAEIKFLRDDNSSLLKENSLLIDEREAAWKEVDRLKSAAPQSELRRKFILSCESAKAQVDAVRKAKK